jgi:hypothetical protein
MPTIPEFVRILKNSQQFPGMLRIAQNSENATEFLRFPDNLPKLLIIA